MIPLRGALAVALLLLAAGCARTPAQQRPNIVLIVADDLGSADTGAYGGRQIATPAIVRLATEGIRFTQAYGHTVCAPSRSTLMTGTHLWEDADVDWKAVRYLERETLRQAVRAGDWKAIRPSPGAPLQLFNLKADAVEQHNVAADHPDVVARFARVMDEAHVPPPPQIEPERVGGRPYR